MVELLSSCPGVKLYLAGHDHEGGYAEHAGVHWVTLEAMCEGADPFDKKLWDVVEHFLWVSQAYGRGSATLIGIFEIGLLHLMAVSSSSTQSCCPLGCNLYGAVPVAGRPSFCCPVHC
jgi:hypothetical protein